MELKLFIGEKMNYYQVFLVIFIVLLVGCKPGPEPEISIEPPCNTDSNQKMNNRSESAWAIVADAGKNQQAAPGAEVALDGSSSFARKTDQIVTPTSSNCPQQTIGTETDTSTLTYQWSLVSQPDNSNPIISDPKAVNPRLKTDMAGVYRLKLEVSNQDGNTNSTEVEIEVDPQHIGPTIQVDAGKNQFVGTNSNVTINEGNGTIVNGNNITYQWITLNPLPSPTVVNNITNIINLESNEYQPLQFSPDVAGEYQFKLIIKNDEGTTSEDEIIIKVDEGKNSIPVADAGKDKHYLVSDTVNLTAATSYDADSDVLSYQWFFSAKPSSSQATLDNTDAQDISFTADVEGTYVATLRVRDGKEVSSDDISSEFDSVMIFVTQGNNPPIAFAGANFSMIAGTTTQLYGGGSYDIDGDELSYQWSVEQFPVDSTYTLTDEITISPNFTPDMEGSYDIQLIVTDGNNYASEPVMITVTVDPEAAPDTVAPITTASLQGGSYDSAQTVELICTDNDESGCKNTYFTIDGSEPDIDSDVYSTSINIDEDMTLKYFSVDNWDNVEETVVQEYTINIPTSYTLVVNKNDVTGVIKSDVVGIDCGEICSAEFAPNTEIVLTATHLSELQVQWTGCVSNTDNECTLQLTNDTQVEVTFVSTVNEAESNDSFSEANLIESTSNVIGYFNSGNDLDYYTFEVTERGTFHAKLSHSWIFNYMHLYNSTQEEITKTSNNKSHTMTYTLNPGTYYILVYSNGTAYDLNRAYNLKISGTALGGTSPDGYERNDSFDSATLIESVGLYQGYFDTQNDGDYYKFEVTEHGTFHAKLSHSWVFNYMHLYNSTQEEITKTSNKKSHTMTYTLNPGTYYILVYSNGTAYDLNRAYNLKISGTALGGTSPDGYEGNDGFDSATAIESVGLYQGYFDTQNDLDYYKFEVTERGTFHAKLSHSWVFNYMHLYNSTQEEITKTSNKKSHTMTYTLNPGTYYILVYSNGTAYDLNNAYNLDLSLSQ